MFVLVTQIVQQRVDMTVKQIQMCGDMADDSYTKEMHQQTVNLINLMSKLTITVILSDIASLMLIIGLILLLTKGMFVRDKKKTLHARFPTASWLDAIKLWYSKI